jgi:hypothetical protein
MRWDDFRMNSGALIDGSNLSQFCHRPTDIYTHVAYAIIGNIL